MARPPPISWMHQQKEEGALNAPSRENYYLSAYPAADLDGLTDTLDCDHVSGHPHRDLVCLVLGVHIVDTVECFGHDTVKLLIYFLLRPVVTVVVLNPLEVGDGDTAGVAQNVRDDKAPFFSRISSASGLTPPLASSTMIFALTSFA